MKIALFCLLLFVCYNQAVSQALQQKTSYDVMQMLPELDSASSVIIDGRDSAKFCNGHLKNAVCLDAFSAEASELLSQYLNFGTIVVYCTTKNRTETIVEMLQKLSYGGTIICMMDGLTGWIENGFPVEKEVKNQ